MTKRLTKEILTEAAALLAPDWRFETPGHHYMCHAVAEAAGDGRIKGGPGRATFEVLLGEHGVPTGGRLFPGEEDYPDMSIEDMQCVRFTFLLLLAESL